MTRARAACALGALAAALTASAASAQSEDRFSTDVSATAGYSNNPFAFNDGDAGSALAQIDVSPLYQVLTANSTVTVSGTASVQQYLRRYGRNDNYSGAVDYQLRPSERVTAHGRIDLSSAVLGNFNGYSPAIVGSGVGAGTGTGTTGPVVNPTTPIAIDPTTGLGFVPLPDIGLYGLRNRRKLARASGDVGMQLSERDSITVSGYAEATRYSRIQQIGNYEAYSGSLGYSRRISDRVSAGLRASASFYDYAQRNGDSHVYPVEATVTARLSQLWSLDGALGATFIDNDAVGSTSKTSLSGNANLCRRGERSTMCLFGSRQASPTGLVGTQYVTSGGINWSKRLGERENLSLGASYTKVGGDDARLVQNGVVIGGLPLQNEYAQANIGYDRQISQRLRFVASANYNRLFGNNDNRPDNYGGQVGVAYHFGDLR